MKYLITFLLAVFIGLLFVEPIGAWGANYHYVISVVYIIINFFYLKIYKRGRMLNYEFLFALSFFLCSFLTQYILPFLDNWNLRYFVTKTEVLYKGYIVSMIGYLSYMLALCIYSSDNINHKNNISLNVNNQLVTISNIFCSFFIILFFLNGGMALLYIYKGDYQGAMRTGEWGSFLTFSMISYIVSIMTNICYVIQNNLTILRVSKLFLINSVILLFMIGASGYRSNLLQIVIPLVYIYDRFYRKIKTSHLVCMFVCAIAFLEYSGFTRQGNIFSVDSISFLDSLRDFYTSNAAVGYIIQQVDHGEITYGSNWIMQILSIIPFMQSFIGLFVDYNMFAESSSLFFTNILESYDSGLGTNIIGDIYYSFGLIGVIVLMFFLGYFYKRIENGITPYSLIMLLVFTGNAIFSSRVEYFYIVRMISFSVILFYVENKLSKS